MAAATRRLRRFFSPDSLPEPGGVVRLPPEESRHLSKIIRLKVGDRCCVTDGQGREAAAELKTILSDGRAELEILEAGRTVKPAGPLQLHVFQAVPRGFKFDFLVQKAQEIGVSSLYPLETERTVSRIPEKKQSPKLERWHKIAAEAAKQSGNTRLLEIYAPLKMEEAARCIPEKSQVALLHPDPESLPFHRWHSALEAALKAQGALELYLFLGPEGGFSLREVNRLKAAAQERQWAFHQVLLGNTILRVDTAFLGVMAALRFLFEKD